MELDDFIGDIKHSVTEFRNVMARMLAPSALSVCATADGYGKIAHAAALNGPSGGAGNLAELEPVFDNLDDGVVFIDQERRVIAINEAASRMLGQDRNTALNKLCPSLFQGADCAKKCEKSGHCSLMAEAKQARKFQDLVVRRPDGAAVLLSRLATGVPSRGSLVLRRANW